MDLNRRVTLTICYLLIEELWPGSYLVSTLFFLVCSIFRIYVWFETLKNEQKLEIKRANIKEAKLKDDINNINEELESIKYGTIPAQASKNFELKKNCEEVDKLKEINNQLREKLYLLSRQLYTLEVRKYFFIILSYY